MKVPFSLVFPLYKDQPPWKDLKKIEDYFKTTNHPGEIIAVVDENSQSKPPPDITSLKVVPYPLNRLGKGFALCYGFNQSKGDPVFFWEGNFPVSGKLFDLYLGLMDLVKADIVVGSKRHPLSEIYYTRTRRFYSQLYQWLVRLLFHLNLTDTQVGLKLYRRKVLETVIPKIIVKNWAFDLEILMVAHNCGFKRIIEAPIEIKKHFYGHEVTPSRIINLLTDTLAIFSRKYLLGYYRQKFT